MNIGKPIGAGADRLQTGMRHAFGKAHGTCARVNIGQPLMSLRCMDKNKDNAIEALRRAKYKFPGRQKILLSRKFGFTPYEREAYIEGRMNGTIIPDGVHCKYNANKGPLGY